MQMDITALPFHSQLMLGFIIGSALLCVLVLLGGAVCKGARARGRRELLPDLPPIPPGFPRAVDQLFTACFILFILYSAAEMCRPAEKDAQSIVNWGQAIAATAVQFGIYVPMLVRYACVHPWCYPTRPLRDYLLFPILVWLGLFAVLVSLEGVGFSRWLVEVTGCPEHQDLVHMFSKGALPMKAYIAFTAIVVAPIGEEVCFRGFLYNSLKRWSGIWPAALASGILFGAIHSSLAQMLPLTLFGIVQCFAYEKVRSLWLPIAVHALFNTVSLITTYFLFS